MFSETEEIDNERNTLFRSHFTSLSGFKIHFLANTNSEPPKKPEICPIILVHGLNISGRYMLPLAKALGTFTPILVPDFPGFGRSSKPWPPLSLRRLAAVAARLPTALGYNQADFVGNSFGCQIIIELAAFFPQAVRRIVLQAPTMEPRARNPLVAMLRCVKNAKMEPVRLSRLTLRENLAVCPLRAAYTLFEALRDQPERKLGQIHAPALVVWGASDVIVGREWAESVARSLGHATLKVLPEVSHTANFLAPQALSEAIVPFLMLTE